MTADLPLPPKPPVPSTNLLPAIIMVAMVALACLGMALWLPAPRRPAPVPAVVAAAPHPLPPLAPAPITEYEDPTPASLPSPTDVATTASPSAMPPATVAPRWRINAQPAPPVPAGFAKLAIVIDDMGLDPSHTHTAMQVLPSPTTFAFLPYGKYSAPLAADAHAAGHEILVHVPMEPLARVGTATPSPGPRALRVEQTSATVAANLAQHLAPFRNMAVGANNHMGSRFTQWPDGMRTVLQTLQDNGMLFLDSVTTAHTATRAAAEGLGLPLLRRNVFLDDQPDPAVVQAQLERAIAMARRNGSAIAIGHPHPSTLTVLAERLPQLAAEHVVLVPLTALISQP